MHPDVEVIEVKDDLPEAPEPWAERALEILGTRHPNIAFTSEAYGEPWAGLMGASHRAIDPPRLNYPISGTQLRAALAENWQMLTPPAKAYFGQARLRFRRRIKRHYYFGDRFRALLSNRLGAGIRPPVLGGQAIHPECRSLG